ncbi:MAG TPA: tetratricopeptide repeat protein [Bryobacteraceae bacterium]|jgi:tetratricopeptide (TPR) repeat protein|nr:tetratricopeptide repeat protein [Bryobacteraceae bacterium]
MGESFRLLFRLLSQPVVAMSAILDRGSLMWASIAAVAVSLALESAAGNWVRLPFYLPLLVLAAAYVPGVLLLCGIFGRLGGFMVSFRRDYFPMLACTAMAWSAANLPLAIAGWFLPPVAVLALAAMAYLYFAFLMFVAIRTVFGASAGLAVAVVCLSWIPLVAAAFLWRPLSFLMGWIASPFFLLYAWWALGGEISGLGAAMRNRQHFRRMMDAAALNPHDGEAQYQLGIVYQQRRNYTEAIQRFQNAVRIDPEQTDAHYQLGRMAREQGRTDDALREFKIVVEQDPKHNLSEILRELGAAYLAAGRFQTARQQLEVYIERRAYDPEGLYYYGQALEALGKPGEAREAYARAVEAARTAPRYRRREVARWSRLAQKQERKLKAS